MLVNVNLMSTLRRRCQSSPHAHRVHLALEHVKAEYTSYTPDLINKPAWFIDRVSPPDGKVSAHANFIVCY